MLDFILPKFPKHRTYCEPFGGSGALLFAKRPSQREVYNDINAGLVNLFRVVKDTDLASRLCHQLLLTPNSRLEHAQCKRCYPSIDPVEQARQFFVLVRQSYSSIFAGSWGFSIVSKGTSFCSAAKLVPPASRRLRNVTIENLDFAQLFDRYDAPDTLWYLDPPYLASTRVSEEVYEHELSDRDQHRLLNHIKRLKGMVIVSGYPSRLYDESLPGWKTLTTTVPCYSSPTNQTGRSRKPDRTECLWFNPIAWENKPARTRRAV
jgi:DNA adenine methylase